MLIACIITKIYIRMYYILIHKNSIILSYSLTNNNYCFAPLQIITACRRKHLLIVKFNRLVYKYVQTLYVNLYFGYLKIQ